MESVLTKKNESLIAGIDELGVFIDQDLKF
jgi:hypothetical protein